MTITAEEARKLLDGATPGPWRDFMGDICAQNDDIVIAAMNRSCGARSSEYRTYKARNPIAQTNARLIAAAPDAMQTIIDLHAQLAEARAEVERLREALTPSGDTKADYSGEFSISVYDCEDSHGNEIWRQVLIDWTTIKAIMAAIKSRASLNPQAGKEGEG